jgi:GT2 family glycosyltransferase
MKQLTISIVNYNAGEFLLKCLKTLAAISSELGFEVFVVDNDSKDGSFENAKKNFPQFNYLKNDKNLGFGKAQNQVLKNAKTPYLLTLNPDCEVPAGTLKYLYDFMEENPLVGL